MKNICVPSALSRRLLFIIIYYHIIITTDCCVQQMIFVKRKIKVSITIKQGSENGVNIILFTYICYIFYVLSIVCLISSACTWAYTITVVHGIRYYFGTYSSELAEFFPLPYFQGRSTHCSNRVLECSVTILKCYKDICQQFLPKYR